MLSCSSRQRLVFGLLGRLALFLLFFDQFYILDDKASTLHWFLTERTWRCCLVESIEKAIEDLCSDDVESAADFIQVILPFHLFLFSLFIYFCFAWVCCCETESSLGNLALLKISLLLVVQDSFNAEQDRLFLFYESIDEQIRTCCSRSKSLQRVIDHSNESFVSFAFQKFCAEFRKKASKINDIRLCNYCVIYLNHLRDFTNNLLLLWLFEPLCDF